ncbi:MAG: O-antigen ligase family protein [Patescibacteria group bacterium]|nr:O-antigen ligase family protein [Patescibacteria group bacterium]
MIFLEKIFFYLLIFCLPFQTRKVIYQWSGNGFNEWTSAFLYLTDILILILFLFWFFRSREKRFFKNGIKLVEGAVAKSGFWLVIFLAIGLVSLIQARNIQLGFYAWFKLLEFSVLFFYVKNNFRELFNFTRVAQALVISGFVQSLIAFAQYAEQKSLGLKFLAESPLKAGMNGVAKIIVNGLTIIRPYGTFPHPNILAAFLLFCVFCLYFLWLAKKRSFVWNCLLIVAGFFIISAFWLSFSRTAILVFLFAIPLYFILLLRQKYEPIYEKPIGKIILIFLFIVFCSCLFISLAQTEIFSRFAISSSEQAVGLRVFYNETAFSVINEYPLLGIGQGNFVWGIGQALDLMSSWLYQPVHNVYLLIASETGLLGLVAFLMFLFLVLSHAWRNVENIPRLGITILFCGFLFIGIFDHFFWTLQQGQLMFWIVLGILASQERV